MPIIKTTTILSVLLLLNSTLFGQNILEPTGNVGIGTEDPQALLDVGVSHTANKKEEIRIGSNFNTKVDSSHKRDNSIVIDGVYKYFIRG